MSDLPARLEMILQGRLKHRWGKAIGIGKGIIDALSKGKLPGAEKLAPIIRSENVSLSWFLEGVGRPYLVNHCIDDDDCLQLLDDLFAEHWSRYLLTDGNQVAILLTMPGQYLVGNTEYDYKIIEVICGPIGLKTLQLINETASKFDTFYLSITGSEMVALTKGEIGTYQILGHPDAILNKHNPLQDGESDDMKDQLKVAEPPAEWHPGGGKISSEELADVEAMRHLSRENLAHIRAVIRTLAQQAGDPVGTN